MGRPRETYSRQRDQQVHRSLGGKGVCSQMGKSPVQEKQGGVNLETMAGIRNPLETLGFLDDMYCKDFRGHENH